MGLDLPASFYRFEALPDEDLMAQFLVKVTPVDITTVTIGQDEEGVLVVTEKGAEEVDVTDDDDELESELKFRVEPEGAMLRLYALRDLECNVDAGRRGGLVATRHTLSHEGDCWIHEGATVNQGVTVAGDAQVREGCVLTGNVYVAGRAILDDTTVTATAHVGITGSMYLDSVTIDSTRGGVALKGEGSIVRSTITADQESILIYGGCAKDAHIRSSYELVSLYAYDWGWLSVFRDKEGNQCYMVGCQQAGNAEQMRQVARVNNVAPAQRAMLEGFIIMADAARAHWRYEPASVTAPPAAEPLPAAPTPAPPVAPPAAELAQEPSFTELAQRAREAAVEHAQQARAATLRPSNPFGEF